MSRRTHQLLALAALFTAVAVAGSATAEPKKKKAKPKQAPTTQVAAAVPPAEDAPPFDREAAASALTSVDLQKCKTTNAEKGEGHVMITFTPAGAATTVTVDKGPWIGTPVAKCIVAQYKKAKIPAFKGDAVTVGKNFRFD